MNDDELPTGWVWAKLDSVCRKIQDGTHFSPKTQYEKSAPSRYLYITAKNIRPTGLDLSNVSYIDESAHRDIYQRCNPEEGDVLLTKDGVNTGIATVNTLEEEFSLLSSVALLKPQESILTSNFLNFFLNSPLGNKMITGQMTGTAIKRIILKKIRESQIPLPPLAEQRRIVARIEQLLAQRDSARAALDGVEPLLKQMRQRILADAFAGRLTHRQPTDEPATDLLRRIEAARQSNGRPQTPAPPDTSTLPDLPEGWVWVSLGQWFNLERGRFSFRPRNEPRFYGGEYPFVQIGDLPREGGEIKEFFQTLNEDGLKISKKFPKGTALIAIVGATIANTGILTFDSCCPDSLVAIQSEDELQVKFIEFYLRSKKHDIRNESYASGGQPNISLKTLLPYPVPLPPLAEQQRIVARIEALFAQVAAIETAVAIARRRVEQMEPAILNRAFRGQLVPPEAGIDL